MDIPLTHRPDQPLTDDDLLLERVDVLIHEALRRQLWLLFLDADETLADPIMPCDDLPADPHETFASGDDVLTPPAAVARMLARLMPHAGLAAVVLVWERPGSGDIAEHERAWARLLAEECARRGVRVRAQFFVDDRGVRPLTPDDYLGARTSM